MQKTDLPRFVELITALAAAFGKEADEPMFLGYEMALDDVPIASIERAVRSAMRTCKFMPAAVELRELSGEIPPATRAVVAFGALQKTVETVGAYRTVDFDDPIINATVRNLGGWERVCDLPASEFDTFFRKDFERVYVSLFKSGISGEQAAPLVGILDRTNAFNGHKIGRPRLIATGLTELPKIAHREPVLLIGGPATKLMQSIGAEK